VRQKYASASYNGGVVFKPEMVNSIPIPNELDRTALIGLVDNIITARTRINQITKKIHATIRASGGPAKLRRKFSHWHLLDSATFLMELQAQGLTLTVKNRPEWVDLFDGYKNDVQTAYGELIHSTKAIDDAIATAYGLNDNEKAAVLA
jgi:hypothetical protein